MPKIHVVDPLLKGTGGHYLTQHMALWSLCQSKGYDMVSYVHVDFDKNLMPSGVTVVKVFGNSSLLEMSGHFSVELGLANARCYQELQSLDISEFSEDDIVFMTSLNAERVIAYGKWLNEVSSVLSSRVGLYAIVSSEVDDTLGRTVRRSGVTVSDDSFSEMDRVVIPNDLKRSMYRYLFESIPSDKVEQYRIFYEEPFPNRSFLSLSSNPRLKFVHLHSMYPGETNEISVDQRDDMIRIAYLGSGGVGDLDKGQHMMPDLVEMLNESNDKLSFSIQIGFTHSGDINSESFERITRRLEKVDNVELFKGVLDCDHYYSLIEQADIVVLPYGPRYKHWMSGVFDECLHLGKVCVIPAGSKMAYWMEHHNLDAPSFESWDTSSIVQSVQDAIANYSMYRGCYQAGSKICRVHWERNNPIDAFFQ